MLRKRDTVSLTVEGMSPDWTPMDLCHRVRTMLLAELRGLYSLRSFVDYAPYRAAFVWLLWALPIVRLGRSKIHILFGLPVNDFKKVLVVRFLIDKVGEECLDGWVGAGGGEVKGGGVVFGVSRILLGVIPRDIMGESGGEAFGVDGGAD
ncbi:hypothetical protein Tco_0870769 [Tanacetum coccineum]